MPEKEPPREKSKEQLLRDRWKGQEDRLQRIVDAAKKEEDWSVYLEGLEFVDDVPVNSGERFGRDLRSVPLDGLDLSRANLSRANLHKATLVGAYLSEANFSEANASRADLRGAELVGADLSLANLSGTKLGKAYLSRANLHRANLYDANLSGANLSGANLSSATLSGADLATTRFLEADLSGAQFSGAKLSETDLRWAILRDGKLRGVELKNSRLRETSFRDADLQDAKLVDVEEFTAGQLGGANVGNTELPKDIQEFEVLGHVEEASKNARKIFLTMLLGCVYSWLTIATTTDVRLLTNSATSPLPIIGTEIPIVAFYWAAPLLLFGFFVYFHLCMQRLWEGLANLPAIFPDGRALDERIYPWLLTGLVRAHFARLRENRPAFSRLEEAISIFLAWCIVPLTMLLFWWRYLYRHGWYGTGLHVVLLGLSVLFGIAFYRLAVRTLRGKEVKLPHTKGASRSNQNSARDPGLQYWVRKISRWLGTPLKELQHIINISTSSFYSITVLFIFAFLILSSSAILAIPPIGRWTRANVCEADVSAKPANWAGNEINLVKGAKLKEANLRYCLAYKAFLVYADLRDADLSAANLLAADLRAADLSSADLREADLSSADLRLADLTSADVRAADLFTADLRDADLEDADLRNADLESADLRNANLGGADLRNANLGFTDLRNANLGFADFRNANLLFADLRNAELGYAEFTDAFLTHADLRDTIGVTEEQVKSAIINANTQLPKDLEHLKQELLKAQKERETSEAAGKGKTPEQKDTP
jgi:uncharacterized protein YjbI with pentapeptide repeats